MRPLAAVLVLVLAHACAHAAPSPAPPALDDAGWAKYYGSQYVIYVAMRSPRELPGPHLEKTVKQIETQLTAGQAPEDLLARAVREKIIARPLDVFAKGMAIGIALEGRAGHALLVAERTPGSDAVLAWAKKAYVSGPFTVKEVKLEGALALVFRTGDKVQLVAAVDGTALLMADREQEVAGALKTRKSAMLTLTGTRAYAKLRARAPRGAAAFAALTPGPELAQFLKLDAAAGPAAQMIDTAMGTLDSYLIALSGDARAQSLDFYFGLDAASRGYAQLHLADRAKFYASHALSLASTVPADVGLYFAGLQPSFDTRQLPASVGFLGQEQAAANQQQWDVLKGQLQVFTGLSFDSDVVPWLGSESAFVMRLAPGDKLEGALLLATKDQALAQASLDRAIRHMGISQNRAFDEATFGTLKARVAKPVEGNPLTPVLAVTPGALVLASGPAVVEALAQYPLKVATADVHQRLVAAIGDKTIIMMGWAQSSLLTRVAQFVEGIVASQAARPPRPDVAAPLEGIEAIGAGLSMPEADLVHGLLHVTTK